MRLWHKRVDDRSRAIAGRGWPTRADALASGAGRGEVEASVGHPVRDAALYGGLMGLSFGGVPALALGLLALLPGVLAWPLIVAMVAGIVLVAFTLVRGVRKHQRPRAWLALGLCPGCAYGLTGIEPEADGCRVCPECGSAWRLDQDASPPSS